jgi:hypothetical protein
MFCIRDGNGGLRDQKETDQHQHPAQENQGASPDRLLNFFRVIVHTKLTRASLVPSESAAFERALNTATQADFPSVAGPL